MEALLPADRAGPLDTSALAARYAYPDGLAAPYVRVSFVVSVDGAMEVEGRSAGLSSAPDKQAFRAMRGQADVVLVGAGTARAENYNGVRRRGPGAPAPVAVVSGSARLDPASRLFTDTHVPPIVLTGPAAPPDRRAAIAAAGGEVVVLDTISPKTILAELGRRGLHRVLCEGGPRLHGQLVAADAVDELCVTVAPLLAGGRADRIAVGPAVAVPRRMEPAEVLHQDGVLLLRYRRARAPIE